MLAFRYRNSLPPGGKRFYLIPGTTIYYETYGSWLELTRQIEQYYRINKKDVPADLQARMENYMCLQLPPGFCMGDDPRKAPSEFPLTYFEITDKTERYYRGHHRGLVTSRIADDRATICVTCEMNARGMCTNCNGLRSMASKFVGGRKLNQDPLMGVCKRFRLPLNALVHTQDIGEPPKELPACCWAKEVTK